MAISEKKIREKILSEIWALCPDSKKIPRNTLPGDVLQWAGRVTHEVEIDGEMLEVVHGWIVRRVAFRPRGKESLFEQLTFQLLGLRGFVPGTDAENSEDQWQQTIESIGRRLADEDYENPVWDFEGEADEVTTESVDFRSIGLIQSSVYLHSGDCRLVVNVHRC